MMRSSPRQKHLLFAVAFFLLANYSSVFGQQEEILILDEDKPSETAPKPEISITSDQEPEAKAENYQAFYDQWASFVQSVQSGDAVAAQNAAAAMLELKRAQEVPKLTEFALSAVRLGQVRMDAKDASTAIQYFSIASKLDPTLPSAYYNEAVASLNAGIGGAGTAIVAGARGFLAPKNHLRGHVYFNSKLTFLVLAALALTGAAFALILLIRYNHLLRHDLEEKYSRKFSPTVLNIAVWFFLFVPVIVFFGSLWLAPFWLMIFIRYARLDERIAALALIPVYILTGPALQKAVHEAALLQDPSVGAFYTAFMDGPSPRAIQDLQRHLSGHPDDVDAAVLLASLYERNQMMDQAIDLLQKIMVSSPQDARAPNNLASIFFSRGELDYALRLAQKAAALDSRNAVYKFNLSNIYRAKFDFNEANSFMEAARKTDPRLIERLERTSHEKVVDVVPTPELLEKRLAAKKRSFFSFFVNPFSIVGALFLVGAILRTLKNPKQVIAKECMKCGTAFCKKCQPNTKIPGFCIQCLHIFVRKDGVSPASRKEKMEEIEHYSRRQRLFSKVASLLLPGAGTLLQERTIQGLALLIVWFLVLSLLGFTWRFAGSFFFEPAESYRIISLVCFVLLGAIYIFANIPLSRKPKSA